LALIAANTQHRFRIELQQDEVPEDFRQLVSQPRGYRGFCLHNGKQCCGFDTVPSSKADDGRFELCMMVRRSRQEFRQMWKYVLENGAFPCDELSTTSQLSFASVTSMMAIPETSGKMLGRKHADSFGGTLPKESEVLVDGDKVGGTPFRIGFADVQLRIFA
jgi:hypothetical protein